MSHRVNGIAPTSVGGSPGAYPAWDKCMINLQEYDTVPLGLAALQADEELLVGYGLYSGVDQLDFVPPGGFTIKGGGIGKSVVGHENMFNGAYSLWVEGDYTFELEDIEWWYKTHAPGDAANIIFAFANSTVTAHRCKFWYVHVTNGGGANLTVGRADLYDCELSGRNGNNTLCDALRVGYNKTCTVHRGIIDGNIFISQGTVVLDGPRFNGTITLYDPMSCFATGWYVNANGDIVILGGQQVIHLDSATKAPVSQYARDTEPSSPAERDVYLDDGTNVLGGLPAYRYYDGANWVDISPTGGNIDGGAAATVYTLTQLVDGGGA